MSEYFDQDIILININISDKKIERNIEWNVNETVYSLKAHLLKIVPGLEDPLNYGFFLPSSNGKIGKFLQEERIIKHYSPENSFKLELIKKTRLYQHNVNSPKVIKINSKSNQKQFVQYIRNGDVMKINKNLCDGIDPNFHIPGIPETPLTLACKLKDPHVIIMALANNGAYLDFRASDSLTALHKAAIEGLFEPMKTLLQLGQSPNCKDSRGYTPLYYCIENDSPAECVELLLFEHSIMGIRDEHGLQEIHKACLYGRTNHLDHLISYCADIDAKTNKGNTALHICAVHNQGACARLLLYRGIIRHALNEENKSAYQTALLSNNLELADLIQNFRDEDVVPLNTLPKYNEKRRSIILSMKRFSSLGQLSNGSENNQDNQTISSDEIISLNDSRISLPHGIVSTPNTPQRLSNYLERKSDSLDCHSLHNFPRSKSKDNFTHLNTWSSAENGKMNIKTRLPIASIVNSEMENIPRVVVLQKSSIGFGFIIRGSKKDNDSEFIAKPSMPATHYFEGIAENSPSQRAGLLTGDFLLEVNNIDVHKMSHNEVVRIIQMAGDNLTMKIITVNHAAASNGLFDGCSEARSYSDSVSLMSENSVSLSACQSNCVFEGTSDSRDVLKATSVKSNQFPRQNMSPLLPTDSKEDDFIKSKLKANSQNNKKNLSSQETVKVIKAPAPPPPVRADNTLLTTSNSSNDISCTYSHDNNNKSADTTITPNELSSSSRSIDQPLSLSTNSSKSFSKVYIPPVDYSSDIDTTFQSKIDQRNNTETMVTSALALSVPLFSPPPPAPPPPPPPPPPSQNCGSGPHTPSPHFQNLDKAISAVSLKSVVQNDKDSLSDDSSSNLSNHAKALRDAILSHRKKVESSDKEITDIDGKLKESKVGNRSIVFEANSTTIQSPDISKQKSDNNPKIAPTISNKNPPLKPKPVPQTFFAVGNNKLPVSPASQNSNTDILKNHESNLRVKAEQLRTDLVKKEQENKKGTLYFTNHK